MTTTTDALGMAVDGLRHASSADIVGHQREWAESVDQALAIAELAIRQRAAPLKPADGRVVDVDRPRLPSPTVARRTAGLRTDLNTLFTEAKALRTRAQTAARAFGPAPDFPEQAGGPPSTARAVEVPDFGALRQQVEQLAEAVEHYVDEEARLVLESVNTDIGSPD
jgi:hypothetical protein